MYTIYFLFLEKEECSVVESAFTMCLPKPVGVLYELYCSACVFEKLPLFHLIFMFLLSSSPWPCLLLNSLYSHQEAIMVIKSTYVLLSNLGQFLFGCFHVWLSLPLTKNLGRLGITLALKFTTAIPACISSCFFHSQHTTGLEMEKGVPSMHVGFGKDGEGRI